MYQHKLGSLFLDCTIVILGIQIYRHFRNGITSFQEWYYVISGMVLRHFRNGITSFQECKQDLKPFQ